MKRLYLWYGLMAAPALAIFAFIWFQPIQVLPRIALAPGFALTDQAGALLTSEAMRGRLVLYNFTYTHCQPPCPQTGEVMQTVQHEIATLGQTTVPIELVTISFDPERDTPERLANYTQSVGADTTNWHFVTGKPSQLKQMIGGNFNTYYSQDEEGRFIFDPAFILVDGWGIQRANYRTATPSVEMIIRDFNLLIEEAENSQGVTRYAYEAAHLFLCYP